MHTLHSKLIVMSVIAGTLFGYVNEQFVYAKEEVPFVHAASACLMDVDTGRVLYAKFANQPMRIASLTKIVTAWIAVRQGKLDKTVTISRNAAYKEGSSVYLKTGERVKLRDLLYAMMLRSGNDAATAVAEAVAGNTDQFAALMNAEVKRLHLHNSHFVNPHGLDASGHYSSAYDLAQMTTHALKVPLFHRIVSTKYYDFSRLEPSDHVRMKNKNKLLWQMDQADGVKTGYTRASGRCLASSASRDGRQVVLIVLNDPSDWLDAKNLLSYGLTAYQRVNVAKNNQRFYALPVRDGVAERVTATAQRPFYYPLSRNEISEISYQIENKPLRAPIRSGQIVGKVKISLNHRPLSEVPLVASSSVPAKSWWGKLRGIFK